MKAINRALEGIKVPTIVHLCFGYAAVVPGETKPSGYSFLAGACANAIAEQISIEAAQPKLDLGVLKDLAGKKVMLGVLDLGDSRVETAADRRRAHPRRAEVRRSREAGARTRLRHEISPARARLREA